MEKSVSSYEEGIKKKIAEESLFDVEKWYAEIEEHTFKSVFLPISVEEGLMLREKYKIDNRMRDQASLSAEYAISFETLEKRISEVLTTSFGGRPVFVRLSTRSPKDVANIYDDPATLDKSVSRAEAFLKQLGLSRQVLAQRSQELPTSYSLKDLITEKEANHLLRHMLNTVKDTLKVIR